VLCLLVSEPVTLETTTPRESVIKLSNAGWYWGRWEAMNSRANKTTSRNRTKQTIGQNKLRQINLLKHRLRQFLARSKNDCQANCHEISCERETHCARLRACQR
jgi:hypothetical protein